MLIVFLPKHFGVFSFAEQDSSILNILEKKQICPPSFIYDFPMYITDC